MFQGFQGMDYVYEVYREKSFSRAARNLMISQPSLSATIKRIEQRIGSAIFDRGTNPISLTECGLRYIQAVEAMHGIEKDFESYLEDLHGLQTGHLSIGGTNLFSSYVLPPLIGEFTRRFPKVELELIEESTSHLEELLVKGRVDLVIENFKFDELVFDRFPYAREHLVLTVPRNRQINELLTEYQVPVGKIIDGSYLLDSVKPVNLAAFKDEPFIFLKKENDTRERGMRLCQNSGFTPKITLSLDQQVTTYNLTCSGMGVSFISDTLIQNVPPHGQVVYYKLQGEETGRSICFYRKAGRYMSQSVKEFLKIAQERQKRLEKH